MRGFLKASLVLLLLQALSLSEKAFGYVLAKTESGQNQRWTGDMYLPLAGFGANRSGMSAPSVFSIVSRALQKWQYASGGKIKFDYWQGTDPSVYEPNRDYNGLSSFYFLSEDNRGEELNPQVIGMTQVWYDRASGVILETDIVINDVDYVFTNDPRDTLSFGSNRVYLDSVVTHELGHAFGLAHSGTLQSSMLYVETPEQFALGCDDQAGMKALYGSLGASAGAITGKVTAPNGGVLFGALVSAISIERSEILASAITDPSGNFRIEGLEPTEYALMVEPYSGGRGALSPYYADIQFGVCGGGSTYRRSFLMSGTSGTGKLRVISLTSDRTRDVGRVTVQCGSQSPFPRLSEIETTEAIAAYVTEAPLGQTTEVNWSFPKDHIEMGVLSFSLFSPIWSRVDATLAKISPLDQGQSGFTNFDQKIVADVPQRTVSTTVEARMRLDSAYNFGVSNAVEEQPFTLFTFFSGTRRGKFYPQAPRCRINESSWADYASPAGDPLRKDTSGTGFCANAAATVSAKSQHLSPRQNANRTNQIVGWWLSMSLSLFGYAFMRCIEWFKRSCAGPKSPLRLKG